jgi:hypothetical protein
MSLSIPPLAAILIRILIHQLSSTILLSQLPLPLVSVPLRELDRAFTITVVIIPFPAMVGAVCVVVISIVDHVVGPRSVKFIPVAVKSSSVAVSFPGLKFPLIDSPIRLSHLSVAVERVVVELSFVHPADELQGPLSLADAIDPVSLVTLTIAGD